MTLEVIDKKLSEIPFYKQYPVMKPYIGVNYISEKHHKLLVVAESYYLPKESKLHHIDEVWYSSNENNLEKEEYKKWINCRRLLSSKWSNRSIYRKINKCLLKAGLNGRRIVIDEIAFTNFFLRPSYYAKGIKPFCTRKDKEFSKEVFENLLSIIKPDIIIFVSKFSYEVYGSLKMKHPDIKFHVTFHPQTGPFYWYNKSRDGQGTQNDFIKIIKEEFIIH